MAFGKFSVVAVVVMMSWMTSTRAQTAPGMSCIEALLPCTSFLNSTNPPAACCQPLTEAFKTQLTCLCAAFNNPALIAAANINLTQIIALPKNCGIDNVDPNICPKGPAATNAPPKALAPNAPPKTLAPEATPSIHTPAPPPGTGAASSIAPVSALVLILVGLMIY